MKINASKPEGFFKSQLEKKIYKKIKSEIGDKNIDIKINQRGVLKRNKNLELDLYFPQFNLGVEIQGPIHTSDITNIIADYKKKKIYQNEGIDIMYIYTNNYKNLKFGIKQCISNITSRYHEN